MSVRWALGAVLAVLAGAVAADECSDYRAGVVLYRAAERALDGAVGKLSTDERDSGEAEVKLLPYHGALERASRALSDARLALMRTIDAEVAATAIDAIVEARAAIAVAYERVSDWRERATEVVPLTRANAASFELQDAFERTDRALEFALNIACRESTQ